MPRHGSHDFHASKTKMHSCLDCPVMIPAGKLRCSPCASARYDELHRARHFKRKAVRLAAAEARRKANNIP